MPFFSLSLPPEIEMAEKKAFFAMTFSAGQEERRIWVSG